MYQARYATAAYYLALLSIPSFFALSSVAAVEALVAVGDVRATYHANIVRLSWLLPTMGLATYSGKTNAILVVIALRELPATIYSWQKLHQKGILAVGRELFAFFIGALGILSGWMLYKAAGHFYPIVPVGLLY